MTVVTMRPPKGWRSIRLKFLASMQSGKGIVSSEIESEGPFPVYGGNGQRGFTDSCTHIGSHVLIGRQGALCGNVHRVDGTFWASEHAVVASASSLSDVNWLYYLLCYMNLNQYSISAAQPGLAVERIKELPSWVPPLPTQKAIANFLDRKTAAIDAMIVKKLRLLELLKEKRSALINQAVTKGLDPSVPMKDSGISWIGEIPAHWEVVAFRRVIQRLEQGWSPPAEDRIADDGEWGVLKLSAFSEGRFFPSRHKTLPPDLSPKPHIFVKEGDLLMTRANTPDLVGAACVVKHVRPGIMLSDLIYRIGLNERAEENFVCAFLQSSPGRAPIEADARGSSQTMVKISQNHIKDWPLPLPPRTEQKAIKSVLSTKLMRLHAIEKKAGEQISKLQEYRQALITAAVTGQIDIPVDEEVAES